VLGRGSVTWKLFLDSPGAKTHQKNAVTKAHGLAHVVVTNTIVEEVSFPDALELVVTISRVCRPSARRVRPSEEFWDAVPAIAQKRLSVFMPPESW